jgi:hypothetical protein
LFSFFDCKKGGVIGKVNPFQMLFLSFVEVILYALNIFVGVGEFNAIDIGGSIFIHTCMCCCEFSF